MPESRNVVITGGARGLGRVLARTLLHKGHNVFLIDIDEEELKYVTSVHIPEFLAKFSCSCNHGKVSFKTTDLADPAAIQAAVKAAAEVFGGKIDVLVNNAGIARAHWSAGRSMDDPLVNQDWAAYLAVNLTAPFLMIQACIPFMKIEDEERKDHEFSIRPEAVVAAAGKPQHEVLAAVGPASPCIINISSFRALQSEANCEGYASTKAGVLGLTHAMAMTGARWGIRCNAILPGFTYVLHECKQGDEAKEVWAQDVPASRHRQHPAGRIGTGDDVAKTVEWLMDADFVTGQEIVVDGGASKVKHHAA